MNWDLLTFFAGKIRLGWDARFRNRNQKWDFYLGNTKAGKWDLGEIWAGEWDLFKRPVTTELLSVKCCKYKPY